MALALANPPKPLGAQRAALRGSPVQVGGMRSSSSRSDSRWRRAAPPPPLPPLCHYPLLVAAAVLAPCILLLPS